MLFSRCFCFSLGSTRLAAEDGCNSGYCFGASGKSFVSKISVFPNMMFCWFMSWSSSVQVYNRFTRDFCGYCVRVFFLTTHEVKILVSSLINFFYPASKKPIAFNYSTFWSSLIIWSSLTNARGSLEFNIHIGKLRIMLVTCFWIYWLKWDTIVL